MVRPRPGPMVFSREESEVIFQDAHTLKKAGADGLVFGALTRQGTIDYDLCKTFRMVRVAVLCAEIARLKCHSHCDFSLVDVLVQRWLHKDLITKE